MMLPHRPGDRGLVQRMGGFGHGGLGVLIGGRGLFGVQDHSLDFELAILGEAHLLLDALPGQFVSDVDQ